MILHQSNLQSLENLAFFWFQWTLGISHTQAKATQLIGLFDNFVNEEEMEQYYKLW